MSKTWVRCIFTLSALVLALGVQPLAGAWSNGGYSSDPFNPVLGTHDWIADMALTMQTRNVTFLSATYHAKFLLGTEIPDNPAYIGDTVNHHVYYKSGGAVQDDVGADRASAMYLVATGYMDSKDYENAAYYIGAMTHYIADVGVFGHTMGAVTDWGAETHHSDYENEIESMLNSFDPPSTSLRDTGAYDVTMTLAKSITFGGGSVKANAWMDTNYDWADAAFAGSAMASLYGSVTAVAAAINHLLIEAGVGQVTSPEPDNGGPGTELCIGVLVVSAAVVLYAVKVVGKNKKDRRRKSQ